VFGRLDLETAQEYQARVCACFTSIPKLSSEFLGRFRKPGTRGSGVSLLDQLKHLVNSEDPQSQVQFGEKLEYGEVIRYN
jgi:hypothetical protein